MASKLEMIKEQMLFLLEKQKETKAVFEKEYAEFFSFLEREMTKAQAHNEDDYKNLIFVSESLKEFVKYMQAQINDDIESLEEHSQAFMLITSSGDQPREEEFERMLLDEGERVIPTDQFKQEVTAEAEANQKGIISLVGEFRTLLVEKGARELALLVEAMIDETDHEEQDESEEVLCCQEEDDDKSVKCCSDKGFSESCCSRDEPSEGECKTSLQDDDLCCGKGSCGQACQSGGSCACKK